MGGFAMPWKETSVVDERMELVNAVEEGMSVTEAARQSGVSRMTAYKWLRRFAEGGEAALGDRSRAPRRRPHTTNDALIDRILELRDTWQWGPVKIRAKLLDEPGVHAVPAASTIGALLKAHGRVHRRTRRRVPRRSEPLAHCSAPNRVWCADFKGWFTTQDGRRCDPLTITDGATRYLLCCQIVERTTHALVAPVFDAVFREYGVPDIIRTDNGVPFAHPCRTGLSPLAVGWIKLGITPERIRPGKPQENGRHERMHRTLKEQTLRPPAETWRRQQERFDAFVEHYNFERPHEATENQPPARFYVPSTRPYPARLKSFDYPSDFEPRRVYEKGSFHVIGGKRLHIGEALAGETIALASSPVERYLEIYFGHVRIAYVDTKHMRVITRLPKNALNENEDQEERAPNPPAEKGGRPLPPPPSVATDGRATDGSGGKGLRNRSVKTKKCKPCSRSET